jgi:hypothetical protein
MSSVARTAATAASPTTRVATAIAQSVRARRRRIGLRPGARRSGLAGIIALAPNGSPERLVRLFPQIAESVAQARAIVAAGRGDVRASFIGMNIRGSFSINTTAAIYLSFFDPTGPANMPDNTSRLRAPLLWVAGTADRSQTRPGYAFSRAPGNPLNRYVTVDADHLGPPTASRDAVLAWLRGLR